MNDERRTTWIGRLRAPLVDWRWPAAMAVLLLIVAVVAANLWSIRGVQTLVDDLDRRTAAAECVDRAERSYQEATGRVVIAFMNDTPDLPDAVDALHEATERDVVGLCYDLAE